MLERDYPRRDVVWLKEAFTKSRKLEVEEKTKKGRGKRVAQRR